MDMDMDMDMITMAMTIMDTDTTIQDMDTIIQDMIIMNMEKDTHMLRTSPRIRTLKREIIQLPLMKKTLAMP